MLVGLGGASSCQRCRLLEAVATHSELLLGSGTRDWMGVGSCSSSSLSLVASWVLQTGQTHNAVRLTSCHQTERASSGAPGNVHLPGCLPRFTGTDVVQMLCGEVVLGLALWSMTGHCLSHHV